MYLKRLTSVVITTLLVTSLLLFTGCGENTKDLNDEMNNEEQSTRKGDVIAVVNNEEIMKEELNQVIEQNIEMMEGQMGGKELERGKELEMREELKPQALNQLIEDTLIFQKTKELGLSISDEEIKEELNDVLKMQDIDEEILEQQMQEQGITMEELEEDISNYLIREKLVKEKVGEEEFEISEQELKELYQQQEAEMEMAKEKGMATGEELEDFEDMKDDLKVMAKERIIQQNIGEVIEELREEADIETFN